MRNGSMSGLRLSQPAMQVLTSALTTPTVRSGDLERLGHGRRLERPAVDAERLAESDADGLGLLGQVAPLERLDEGVHLAERRDAGDRLLAERPGEGHGAEQLAVDVDGAA